MQTPRSPWSSGSLASIAAAASRSTLKVPIRLTRMTVSNGSKACGAGGPAIFSAQPMPAQQTEIRSPSSPAAALDGGLDLLGVGHVGGDEVGAELVGERLAALRVEVGDRDVGAGLVQRAGGRRAEARRPAGDERVHSLDVHART